MENGAPNHGVDTGSTITIKGILSLLMANIDETNNKRVISLGMGDPSAYSCFHTTHVAEEAVVDAIQSEKFNGYAPTVGLPQTRRAIAEYLSRDLPYKLSSDDVFVTSGCTQAIDVALAMLARPGANVLLPRPGFPIYELCAGFRNIEVRYFDLLPEKGWEVDLNAIEALADQNTVGLVVINPGNPCGNVYSYEHLKKIAETAKRLRILVIADEVYGHLAFGKNPFVPMGIFGSEVPVLTLGSLSKRWIVPGWRLGWFVTSDPCGAFREPKTIKRIKKYFDILGGPATFIQAAVPHILEQTEEVFFKRTINLLKQASDVCCEKIKEIRCISCPHKPEGSMAVMVKLNLSVLEDISDDIDFCFKLAKEESVIILPGTAVGLKNWLRITFAVDPSFLEEGLRRTKSFYQRHAKQQILRC
ncbi:putative aminotransferase TAT2 [Morella rubra]|uniref:Putative aminotransferase TAT2 n=1 Tax=Morella rubra TaxID=262757 RepID=A0A6A1VUX1_9ROSI|nr:putative aminotransferase TAT2 [Morella rubra]